MAHLLTPWTRSFAPQFPVVLKDAFTPTAKQLWVVPASGSSLSIYNAVTNRLHTITAGARSTTPIGQGLYQVSSGPISYPVYSTLDVDLAPIWGVVCFYYIAAPGGANYQLLYPYREGASGHDIGVGVTTSVFYKVRDTGVTPTTTFTPGTVNTVTFYVKNGYQRFWHNGALSGVGTVNNFWQSSTYMDTYRSNSVGVVCPVIMMGIGSGVIPEALLQEVSSNPWEMFQPDRKVKYFLPPVAAGALARMKMKRANVQPQYPQRLNPNLPMYPWDIVHTPEGIQGTKVNTPTVNVNIGRTIGAPGKAFQWVNATTNNNGEQITYGYAAPRSTSGIIVIKRTWATGCYVFRFGNDQLVIYCTDAAGTTTIEWRGTASGPSISNAIVLNAISNIVWCYDYDTSALKLAINGSLVTATKSWNLTTGGDALPGQSQYIASSPLEMYLLAISRKTIISDAMMISLSKDPWQIFDNRKNTLFFSPTACRWVGGNVAGTTDWSIGANWDTGFVPTKDYDVIIESSAYDCVLTAAATAKSLNIMPNYSATFNTAGYALSLYGNLYLNSRGTVTIDNTITMKASATITTNGKSVTNLTHAVGTLALADAITCTGTLLIKPDAGESLKFRQNGKTLTAAAVTVDQS